MPSRGTWLRSELRAKKSFGLFGRCGVIALRWGITAQAQQERMGEPPGRSTCRRYDKQRQMLVLEHFSNATPELTDVAHDGDGTTTGDSSKVHSTDPIESYLRSGNAVRPETPEAVAKEWSTQPFAAQSTTITDGNLLSSALETGGDKERWRSLRSQNQSPEASARTACNSPASGAN